MSVVEVHSAQVIGNNKGTLHLVISGLSQALNYLPTGIVDCPIGEDTEAEVKIEFNGGGEYDIWGIITQACINCPFGPKGTSACRVGDVPSTF